MRCPAEIVPYHIALLARRLYGKAILPRSPEVKQMIQAIDNGTFNQALTDLAQKSLKDLQTLYEARGGEEK